MKKTRCFSALLAFVLFLLMLPVQTIFAEDNTKIKLSGVGLKIRSSTIMSPEITGDGTVFTFNNTQNEDIEYCLSGLSSSDEVKFYFVADTEKFLYGETGTNWNYGNQSEGMRIGFMEMLPYGTDYDYVIFSFTIRDASGNRPTKFTLRIKKWERQYQKKEVAPGWNDGLFFCSTYQYGTRAVPWKAVAGKPHNFEYVAAEDVTFPYYVTIQCAIHYKTRIYLDGKQIFLPGTGKLFKQVLEFNSRKTHYDFVIDGGTVFDDKHNTTVKSYWRLSVTGKDSPSKPSAAKVSSIKLSSTSTGLAVGRSLQLKIASVKPITASKKVIWSSSNSRILTVSSSGKVTAKNKGTAYISAKAADGSGKTARCKIKVYEQSKLIKYPKSQILKTGKSITIKASVLPKTAWQSVAYKSYNTSVATINAKGKITAKKPGRAKITVTTNDGMRKRATLILTVKK